MKVKDYLSTWIQCFNLKITMIEKLIITAGSKFHKKRDKILLEKRTCRWHTQSYQLLFYLGYSMWH